MAVKRNRDFKQDLRDIAHLTLVIEDIMQEPLNKETLRCLKGFNKRIKAIAEKY